MEGTLQMFKCSKNRTEERKLGMNFHLEWISPFSTSHQGQWLLSAPFLDSPIHPDLSILSSVLFSFFFFLKNFNVFILFLRERESESELGRGRERGRHRIRSSLQALSCQHRAWCGAKLMNHEIVTWAKFGRSTYWATQVPLHSLKCS